MKTFIKVSSFILIFALVCSSCAVWAQNQQEIRSITVTGNAEIKVVPDEVIIALGAQTQNMNLSSAKNENDKTVRAVLEITKKYGVEPKHVQTSRINIEPKYGYYNNKKTFEGYFVTKTITITLKDLSKFENILSGALEEGVNYVYNIQLRTTQLRQYRDKARIMAIRAAYEKAKALAGELGQKVGKPYTILETTSDYPYISNRTYSQNSLAAGADATGADATGAGETLAPGEITVTSSVTVKFELE